MPSTSAITGGSSEQQESAAVAAGDSPSQSPVGSEHAMNTSMESAGSGAGATEVVVGADGVAIERRKVRTACRIADGGAGKRGHRGGRKLTHLFGD